MFLFVGAVGQIGTEFSFLRQRIISSILTKPDFFYLTGNDGSKKQGLELYIKEMEHTLGSEFQCSSCNLAAINQDT